MRGESPDGRDTRWEPHRAARRALILDAAMDLVEESDGGDLHVQQIAARAGLGRAVVYRHFADRAAIERALRGRVFERLLDELAPVIQPDGSIRQIIERIVRTYLDWAMRHPVLHRLVSESSRHVDEEDLEDTIVRVSSEFSRLVHGVLERMEVELPPTDEAIIQPLVLGMVGHALTLVRSWLEQSGTRPPPDKLVDHLVRGFWYQFEGHAREGGAELDQHRELRPAPDHPDGAPPRGK